MTIAAAYLTSEGVVLGADSTATFIDKGGVRQQLHHAQKVFEIGEHRKGRLAACTWGAGGFGGVTHRTILARLNDKLPSDATVEDAAEELKDYVMTLCRSTSGEYVGYFIGGWDLDTHDPHCYIVECSSTVAEVTPMTIGDVQFAGAHQFFSRAFHGYDPTLREQLKTELEQQIGDPVLWTEVEPKYDDAFLKVADDLIARGYNNLPIREAIDYIYSFIHISIKARKFMYGISSVGGPIEVGFITTDRRFRWAVHKTFNTAILEQEGEYHVE